jgi:hypothetical protein
MKKSDSQFIDHHSPITIHRPVFRGAGNTMNEIDCSGLLGYTESEQNEGESR